MLFITQLFEKKVLLFFSFFEKNKKKEKEKKYNGNERKIREINYVCFYNKKNNQNTDNLMQLLSLNSTLFNWIFSVLYFLFLSEIILQKLWQRHVFIEFALFDNFNDTKLSILEE